MKIKWFLPEKYNKKWFLIFIAYTLVLFCLLTGIRLLGISPRFDFPWMAGVFLFSLLSSLIISTFGFLDLRFVFSLTSIGIIIGIILMISVMGGNKNGWEDLIGIALFLEFSVFGLAAGIIAELCAFFIRRMREKKRE